MGKKILVVDNHPMMLKYMTTLLEKEGHQVLEAQNGLAALDLLKTETPEVIFTDLIMPHIDGEKLCQIIRKTPRLQKIPLIILSGIAAEENVDVEAFGANLCIAKGPLDKMARHILSALELLEQNLPAPFPRKTIGQEDVYPRHITKELLSVKKHFEVILGGMSEGILEINAEGRIIYANASAVRMLGMDEEKLLTTHFMELFEDLDHRRMAELFIHSETVSQTLSDIHPVWLNGKPVSLSLYPLTDQESHDRIVILRDLTEQKRMEAQLLQAQKMEAIGTLAGGVAHDFNNLLMVIQGNVSLMLLELHPSHPHYEMLKMIEKKVRSGSRLTSQLLGYASKGGYEVKPLSLNHLIEETSEAFGRTRKSITIHRRLSQDLMPIEADQGQMEQVLMNLLVNAADAMPLGGNIHLETTLVSHREIRGKLYHPKPGDYVLWTVRDTGMGMDSKILDRIFDPFFTTKEFGKGTGLGLALVYGIIKGHGGYIDVESEKGEGTVFRIYLPATGKRVEALEKGLDPIQRGSETILMIDDEEPVLEVGERFLKFMGYRAILARDGEEAVDIYRNQRDQIDLVILDLVMPNMEGGEVFVKLREISPDVKVLLSSGYSIEGKASQVLDRGASGFIQKPFDIMQLSQSIRSILTPLQKNL